MERDQQQPLQMLEDAPVVMQNQLQVHGRLVNQNIKKFLGMDNYMNPTTTSIFHQYQYLYQSFVILSTSSRHRAKGQIHAWVQKLQVLKH
eukprot:12901048-Prorocentrum_lima.AAC.1